MKVLKSSNNRLIYMEYNGLFTVIDTKEMSIVRTAFTIESFNVGDEVSWWYDNVECEMILIESNGVEVAKAIKYVLGSIIPIKDVIWKG